MWYSIVPNPVFDCTFKTKIKLLFFLWIDCKLLLKAQSMVIGCPKTINERKAASKKLKRNLFHNFSSLEEFLFERVAISNISLDQRPFVEGKSGFWQTKPNWGTMYHYYPPQNRVRREHWLILPEGRRPEGNISQCSLLTLFWGG